LRALSDLRLGQVRAQFGGVELDHLVMSTGWGLPHVSFSLTRSEAAANLTLTYRSVCFLAASRAHESNLPFGAVLNAIYVP